MKEYKGKLAAAKDLKIAIVVAKFNHFITDQLLKGALDAIDTVGISSDNVTVAWVPGAFELPIVAKRLAMSYDYDAVICIGTVIRGATAHFDYVAGQAAAGIARASYDTNIPILFGVLTTDTIEQAIERSGTKAGNKGYEVAMGAIEMAALLKEIPSPADVSLTM